MSPSTRAPRFRAVWLNLCLLTAVTFSVARAPAAVLDSLAEYKIKAAYLYNFTKFVEWPPAAFVEERSPYVIGILEHDAAVSTAMGEVLRGKTTVSGRAIEVRSAQTAEALADCHIIFVTRGAGVSPSAIAASRERPVLLVGESAGFAQSGGTINFLISGDLIRLEINPQRAERVGLRLSGTLASIGSLVRDREGKP